MVYQNKGDHRWLVVQKKKKIQIKVTNKECFAMFVTFFLN